MKNSVGTLPLILVIALFITGIFPSILAFAKPLDENLENSFALGGGINAVDVVLLIMFGLAINKIFKIGKKNQTKDKYLFNVVVLFTLWIVFEIFRNIGKYGLSAPGEFRFRYLILTLPLFIAANFDTQLKRKKLLSTITFLSFFVPLLMIPLIGFIKGWEFGSENRFLNAQIHLGMLYGFTTLILLKKYKQIYLSKIILLIIGAPYFFFFFADSHRSVWLSAIVIFIALILLKEIKVNKAIIVSIGVLILSGMSLIVFATYGETFINFLGTRAIAFTEPSQDPTANWRLLVWGANIEKFLNNPLLGQGFGGYWYVYVPTLGIIELFPHSLYIMSLVKIGLIGLSLYLIIITKIYSKMKRFILESVKRDMDYIVVLLSFIYLIAAHFYFTVYSFDYYSMIYIGLGVAVLRNFHTDKTVVNE